MKPFVALGPPSETLLTLRAGYRPLGAVVGVSVVATGNPNAQSGLNGAELRTHTDAVTTGLANARRRAVEQAEAFGATGVVGTRVELLKNAAAPDSLVEVRCVGTAVLGDAPAETPFLSNLHGAELLALVATGHRPVGLAVGYCFYTQTAGYRTTNARAKAVVRSGFLEMPFEHLDFTDATYKARGIAAGRLNADALAVGAEGIVGVEFAPEIERKGETLRVRFVMIGTAVRRDRWSSAVPEAPTMVVPLGPGTRSV